MSGDFNQEVLDRLDVEPQQPSICHEENQNEKLFRSANGWLEKDVKMFEDMGIQDQTGNIECPLSKLRSSEEEVTIAKANKKNSVSQLYLASLNQPNKYQSDSRVVVVPRQEVSKAYIESINRNPPSKSSPHSAQPSKDQTKKLKEMLKQKGLRTVSLNGSNFPNKVKY